MMGEGRWIALQPGARWMNKLWPTEYFVELAKELAREDEAYRFLILGSQQDRAIGQAIANQLRPSRCLNATGKTTLTEMIEWIRLSELLITNDTGPMHVAAALGKPVLALFGPTAPERTGPYGQLDHCLQLDLPCTPCMKSKCNYYQPLECLRALSPEIVLPRVRRRLGDPS